MTTQVSPGATSPGGTTLLEREVVDIEEIVGDLDMACEWYKLPFHAEAPARWIAYIKGCPRCGHKGGIRLVCVDCKDGVLMTPDCAQCHSCGLIISPFRHAVRAFEPINRSDYFRDHA